MSTVFGDDGTARGGGRGDALGRWIGHHPIWALIIAVVVIFFVWLVLAPWPAGFEDVFGKKLIFVNALFNGITLGGLYFLVATGFTLIFGLMRNVNLAHGSLYLFGGYMGYEAGDLHRFVAIWLRYRLFKLRDRRHGHAILHLSSDGGSGSAPELW